MSKRHQWVASGKKTRTGQDRKARHKQKQHLAEYARRRSRRSGR